MMPLIIDVEASGFDLYSYPIEIAWSDHDGWISRYLINPGSVPGWTFWSEDAEALHGLSRDDLRQHGEEASLVADKLNEALDGQVVYSDNVDFDMDWIKTLFHATNRDMRFYFADLWSLMLRRTHLPEEVGSQYVGAADERRQRQLIYQIMKVQRKRLNLTAHRASNDVRVLFETLNVIHNEFNRNQTDKSRRNAEFRYLNETLLQKTNKYELNQ